MDTIARKYARRATRHDEDPGGQSLGIDDEGIPSIVNKDARLAFDLEFYAKFRWPRRCWFRVSSEDLCNDDGALSYNCSASAADRVALVPDNHSHRRQFFIPKVIDDAGLPFEARSGRAIFAGSTSGHRRLDAARYIASHDIMDVDFWFTQVLYMNHDELRERIGDKAYGRCVRDGFLDLGTQLHYKYIWSLDGWGSSWDRPPWILKSQSVLLKDKTDCVLWYDELLVDRREFIETPVEKLADTIAYCNANPRVCKDIIGSANAWAAQYCTFDAVDSYMQSFCEELVELYDP